MDEALRRAEAYHAAGADAVLIHSKKSTAAEITEFMAHWGRRCPVVIVPTMYYATPTEAFRRAGVSLVIWANHLVRASIAAMRQTARRILEDESLREVEGQVASVRDIFHLVGNAELEAAARRYLPAARVVRGIVLAASRGDDGLDAVTADMPKCMVDVRGQPLLRRLIGTLRESGVRDVTVVRGYRKEAVLTDGVSVVDNDAYATTGEVASLACAGETLHGETVVVYGDVLFRRYILDGLLALKADIAIVVDALGGQPGARANNPRDLVRANRKYSSRYLDDEPALLTGIGEEWGEGNNFCGEWIGLMRLNAHGAELVREELAAMEADGTLATADLPALIARLAQRHQVMIHYITGHWLDVDTLTDLADARNFP